jgi:methylglyoxal reductase
LFTSTYIIECAFHQKKRGRQGGAAINIFDPCALENLVPICQKHGVAVIARCIVDEGGPTGLLSPETVFESGDFRHGYFDDTTPRETYIAKVRTLESYVPEHASSLAALALKSPSGIRA